MKKVIGYIIAVAGIVVMALGFGMINVSWKILETESNYIIGVGIAAIVIGVIISLKAEGKSGRKKNEDGKEEVPIYEGVGKKRKIIGYRKD